MTTTVSARGLTVAYNGAPVLDGLDLEVGANQWLCVIGPNGAGKTTLMRALAGLVAFHGSLEIVGHDARAVDRRRLARLVAYVPQRPVMPGSMPVIDYVLMGRTPYIPYFGVERTSDLDIAGEVMERLEVDAFRDRQLGSLSGGEAQRVVLARALAQQADVLLLDEPTSALDVGHQQHVLELVDSLRRGADLTVISTMHDLTLAGQFADTLLLLDAGRPIAAGAAASVLREDLIETHYGAKVRILDDGRGGRIVVPTRDGGTGDATPGDL